ncbi:DUF4870 domain-containing protein [Methylophaga sp.]|jgi:uncharacterized membrane protein|uniref:DUF4870 family protein n=1 Tax=Methylophaga sp. TaxID=2024840 RepID=UPI00140128F1|nr:DUF4870 domain-containing protein [Methylophaga sp.]MTI62719.1 hypothetical protein [Methylophaga sp.]
MADKEQNSQNTAKIVYLLFLVNIFIQFLGIIGVIIAYVNKDDAPAWLQTHYQFQIRTFWIGLLYLFIGVILAMAVVGYFILLFWVIWVIVRCVKGMKYLDQNQAYPNPTTWLFS